MLIAGGAIVVAAALLAGASGFGFGLLATPLLLLAGFSLPFVITVNLLISVATRVSVAYRFRASADPRRVALLVGGSVPGLVLGAVALSAVSEGAVKVAAGVFVMAAAVVLAIIPLQMIAYAIARSRGPDTDQPRNLAKTVTAE